MSLTSIRFGLKQIQHSSFGRLAHHAALVRILPITYNTASWLNNFCDSRCLLSLYLQARVPEGKQKKMIVGFMVRELVLIIPTG
jgi:hypothetical protein